MYSFIGLYCLNSLLALARIQKQSNTFYPGFLSPKKGVWVPRFNLARAKISKWFFKHFTKERGTQRVSFQRLSIVLEKPCVNPKKHCLWLLGLSRTSLKQNITITYPENSMLGFQSGLHEENSSWFPVKPLQQCDRKVLFFRGKIPRKSHLTF